jgi:hypothetical protein
MEAELATLASAGATTLVGLMVSDSWKQVKEGFARLFARGDATDGTLRYLETSQAELATAWARGDDVEVAAIEAELRTRLRHVLRSDLTAGEELRRLLHQAGPGPMGSVHNVNRGNVTFGSVIQAGQILGTTFHLTPTPDEHRQT